MTTSSEWMDRLNAALDGRYVLEYEIRRGGMAIVYLADDVKNQRKVAIKVMRPEFAAFSTERFLREIRVTAKFTHPNILPLLDSGEVEGFLYYVMPYVAGETVRQRLEAKQRLELAEALQLTSEIADALAYAHRNDVIHRDIKPENILLEEGHAVVADFGVAKAHLAAQGEDLTSTGIALGTPSYISPEAIEGSHEADGRADIYSLGCMFYEMLVGEPPFTAKTLESLMYQHLNQDPPDVRMERREVPEAASAIIHRMLAKAPADRFATAEELLESLGSMQVQPVQRRVSRRRLTVAVMAVLGTLGMSYAITQLLETGSSLPRLAVLPVENRGSPEDHYIAFGITDALSGRFASVRDLALITVRDVGSLEGSGYREIAEQLDADYVLDGSVLRERPGDPHSRVQYTPSLVARADGAVLWTDRYDVSLIKLFDVYLTIADSVAAAMNMRLLRSERQAFADEPTDSEEALEYYQRALGFWFRSVADNPRAAQMLRLAVARDSNFGVAWALLSRVEGSIGNREAQREALDQARRLIPDAPETYLAQAASHAHRVRHHEALRAVNMSLERRPSDVHALDLKSVVQRRMGFWDEALASLSTGMAIEPQNRWLRYIAAYTCLYLGDYELAEQYLDEAMIIGPSVPDAYGLYAWVRGVSGAAPTQVEAILDSASELIGHTVMLSQLVRGQRVRAWFGGFLGEEYDRALLRLPSGALDVPSRDYYLAKAAASDRLGESTLAFVYYDSLRQGEERTLRANPSDPVAHGMLAIAYAGLGNVQDALASVSQSTSLRPVAVDAQRGQNQVFNAVQAYIMVGQYESAIAGVDTLTSLPSLYSPHFFAMHPLFDPLRADPRFQALLERSGN